MKKIALTRDLVALVDDADYSLLSQFNWHANKSKAGKVYAARKIMTESGKRTVRYMHREIMGSPDGLVIDHLNGDALDNRRRNLRACTQSENVLNGAHSIGRGFFKCSQTGQWYARVAFNKTRVFLGRFQSQSRAAKAAAAGRKALAAGATPEEARRAAREE